MPTLTASQLVHLGKTILTAAGVPAPDAVVVAEELAEANLVGHDTVSYTHLTLPTTERV